MLCCILPLNCVKILALTTKVDRMVPGEQRQPAATSLQHHSHTVSTAAYCMCSRDGNEGLRGLEFHNHEKAL